MDLLQQFKNHLFSQKKQPSKATIKNYTADIRHFIQWFEEQYAVVFQPSLINANHWKQFKDAKKESLSAASLERHLSSLRKFFTFLLTTNIIQKNPFDIEVVKIEQIEKDPWMVQEFKEVLRKTKASPLTIKNYASDIHQFLAWIDENKHPEIDNTRKILPLLNGYFLEQYTEALIAQKRFTESSLKRKISSIKKYISWIMQQEGSQFTDSNISIPDISNQNNTTPHAEKPEHASYSQANENTEREQNSNQDLDAMASEQESPISNRDADKIITEQEKTPHFDFLEKSRNQNYYNDKLIGGKNQNKSTSANKMRYSKIPPIRLFQKIFFGINFLIDISLVLPIAKGLQHTDYLLWVAKGRPVFSKKLLVLPKIQFINIQKIKNVYESGKDELVKAKKHVNKSLLNYFIPEHIQHILKHKRPHWYHKYHSYPLAHYFHFAVLVIFMSAIGFNLYNSFFGSGNTKPVFASLPTAPPKILSFQGRLTDKNNNPITQRTNVRFAAYNSSMASGSALLWQEVDSVQPDKNGNISVPLGNKSFLDQNLFTKNNALWLGVTVEQADELKPRQQLATTGYAANAESLQGLQPITNPDAGTKNVVLALDSAGNLTMNDTNDHTFQATGGQFILSGNTLVLGTNAGSSSDVQINPDGFGQVDIQKPIHNTSNYNNIPSAIGSVEVDDTFAILASSSGQSAFTLNQNGYGPLISASSSGVAKFTIENDGSIFSAGDLSIKGFVNSNLTPFGNSYNLGSNQSQWNNLFVKNIYLDGTPLTQTWQEDADSIHPINQTKNLLIGLTASTSANFEVEASSGAIFTQGNISLNGNAPTIAASNNQTLTLGNAATGAIALNPNNQTGLFVSGNGSVGIGTQTIPNDTALTIQKDDKNVFSITNSGNVNIAGSIGTNPGDLAEQYTSSQQLEPGDIVMPAADGNNAAVVKSTNQYQSQVIGVVSTAPGVVLNSAAQTDSIHTNKYPIALSGRVPVKVSIANGVIRTGDLLTSSAIPGVAMKATEAGPIIGKALEDYSSENQGSIMAYISVSFGNPSVSLADNGNLNTPDQVLSNLNSDQKNIIQKFLEQIANGTQITMDNIFANIISAKDVIADRVLANNILIAPIANINEVHSNLLSPLSEKGKIALSLNDNTIQIHNGNSASSAAVTTFDNQGNATFSGQVNSNGLLVNNDATISGTLHAGKILASDIEGLPQATSGAQYITNVTNIYNATASGNVIASDSAAISQNNQIASSNTSPRNDGILDISSYSAQLANVPALQTNGVATFEQGLVSFGPTTLSDTAIAGQLSIGSQFVFANNSINVLGGDLELQPLKQGGVSIAGRQLYIDTNGNITANGNATFNGMLAANTITPVKDHDLTVKLDNGHSDANAANFKVTNASNSALFSVSQLGDIIASGAATISKLNFNVAQPAMALSDHEIMTNGSAGVATISANETFVQIDNKLVTEKSLIYITPVGQTGQAPFLLKQVPGQSFSVGISQKGTKSTMFNWLIIN